jgi:hypothetical protein
MGQLRTGVPLFPQMPLIFQLLLDDLLMLLAMVVSAGGMVRRFRIRIHDRAVALGADSK